MAENIRILEENKELIDSLRVAQEGLILEVERANRLLNLESLFKPLSDGETFQYLPACRKFIVKELMGIEIFEPGQTIIKNNEIKEIAMQAGFQLESFLTNLVQQDEKLSYLLVIEGNMANTWDRQYSSNNNYGYITSYQRALALYNLWIDNGINFRHANVEVMLCGSGFSGLCRDDIEENNKRFSIQIIPKVSK